jgi:hypothetical protein
VYLSDSESVINPERAMDADQRVPFGQIRLGSLLQNAAITRKETVSTFSIQL